MKMLSTFKLSLATGFLVVVQSASVLANDVISIGAFDVAPKDRTIEYSTNGAGSLKVPPTKAGSFHAPLILPQGAIITRITMEAHDSSGGGFGSYVKASLLEQKFNTLGIIADFDTGISEAPGDTRIVVDNINFPVNNAEYSYRFGIEINNVTGASWGDEKFYKFIVEYEQTQLRVVRP